MSITHSYRKSPGLPPLTVSRSILAPSGRLAIVFTDIERSCALWESSPQAMSSAIKTHNSILRNELKAFGGYEVKTTGDGIMASFQTPTAALSWSLSVQKTMLETSWPVEILNTSHRLADSDSNIIRNRLSVRIGVHWGTPFRELDPIAKRMDYFGDMINRASRITALAQGGEILVSGTFYSELQQFHTNAGRERPNSTKLKGMSTVEAGVQDRHLSDISDLKRVSFESCGMCNLKGLRKQELLYLVHAPLR